ncbi:MAG: hypothetical protein DI538_23380 [Azospira oryzae]|nr:MAG: hypothetical protein DI538_23380 [Azospira oryzae]
MPICYFREGKGYLFILFQKPFHRCLITIVLDEHRLLSDRINQMEDVILRKVLNLKHFDLVV